jgi:hypothetical protein
VLSRLARAIDRLDGLAYSLRWFARYGVWVTPTRFK